MKRLLIAVVLLSASLHAQRGAAPPGPETTGPGRPASSITPVTDSMLANPDPNDWMMWRRTLNTWGFSPLDQIKKSNVKDLRMTWTRGLTAGIQEGTPLVHNGVMFIPNPGDDIMAVDAKTGDPIWEYKRKLPEGVRGKTNRAMAMWGTT